MLPKPAELLRGFSNRQSEYFSGKLRCGPLKINGARAHATITFLHKGSPLHTTPIELRLHKNGYYVGRLGDPATAAGMDFSLHWSEGSSNGRPYATAYLKAPDIIQDIEFKDLFSYPGGPHPFERSFPKLKGRVYGIATDMKYMHENRDGSPRNPTMQEHLQEALEHIILRHPIVVAAMLNEHRMA